MSKTTCYSVKLMPEYKDSLPIYLNHKLNVPPVGVATQIKIKEQFVYFHSELFHDIHYYNYSPIVYQVKNENILIAINLEEK